MMLLLDENMLALLMLLRKFFKNLEKYVEHE